ncbi:hypothetical protein RRG08_060441 [Elysia crispata]|uniref:Uncharacterized protein n=1 Tax=Elysia crispata TaxID=231223 RepID=A0AAE1ALJ4_9GAST|nr:hypothetical protein RRG08_060441 [Elysia crispata]
MTTSLPRALNSCADLCWHYFPLDGSELSSCPGISPCPTPGSSGQGLLGRAVSSVSSKSDLVFVGDSHDRLRIELKSFYVINTPYIQRYGASQSSTTRFFPCTGYRAIGRLNQQQQDLSLGLATELQSVPNIKNKIFLLYWLQSYRASEPATARSFSGISNRATERPKHQKQNLSHVLATEL